MAEECEFTISIGTRLDGILFYLESERSFDFETLAPMDLARMRGESGVCSIQVGASLQLEVGVETGLLLFAWGYCPYESWQKMALDAPTLEDGQVVVRTRHGLNRGVSHKVGDDEWCFAWDPESTWFRASRGQLGEDRVIQFASGCSIGLNSRGTLSSVWLNPILREYPASPLDS